MKAKVIKKQNKHLLEKLQGILEVESSRVESCIDICVKFIEKTTNQIYPGTSTRDEIDMFQSFICHGISVALIKSKEKMEN